MAGVKLEIDLRPLLRALDGLDKRLRKKGLRAAVFAASKPVLDQAKAGAKRVQETGNLWKSLGRKAKVYPSGVAVAVVGPRTNFRFQYSLPGRLKPVTRWAAKYAHLVEGGARPHAVGRGSSLRRRSQSGRAHPGARAQPFLGPAVRQGRALALSIMANVLRNTLEDAGRPVPDAD